MTDYIRFVGEETQDESQYTGRGSKWWPGEVRQVSDAVAIALESSGMGWERCRPSDTNDIPTVRRDASGVAQAVQVDGVDLGGELFAPSGDGVTPDGARLSLLVWDAGEGATINLEAGGTYIIDRSIVMRAGQTLRGNGATLRRAAQVSTTTTTTITAGVTTVITVADATGLQAGMYIGAKNGSSHSGLPTKIANVSGTTITLSSALSAVSMSGTSNIYTVGHTVVAVADCRIDDVGFDGNASEIPYAWWENTAEINVKGSRVSVIDCVFNDLPGEGVMEGGATIANQKTGCVYARNRFDTLGGNAFHFSGSRGTVVDANVIVRAHQNTSVGHVSGAIGFSATCSHQRITNNYIDTAQNGIGEMSGWDNRGVYIAGNVMRSCVAAGIYMRSGARAAADDIIIEGNQIYCTGSAVPILIGSTTAATNTTVTGTTAIGSSEITAISVPTNVVIGCGLSGTGIPAGAYVGSIFGSTVEIVDRAGTLLQATANGSPTITVTGRLQGNCTIKGNLLVSSGAAAIGLTRIDGVCIEGNHVVCGGIAVSDVGLNISAQVANAIVSDNIFKGGYYGIRMSTSGASGLLVRGNVFADQYELSVSLRSNAVYVGSAVSGNVFTHSVAHSGNYTAVELGGNISVVDNTISLTGAAYGYSIRSTNVAGAVVKNNTIRGNYTWGTTIQIEGTSSGYVVCDNAVNKAIVDASAAGVRVANNDLIV